MQFFVDDFDRIPEIQDFDVKRIFSQPRAHWLCKNPKNLEFRLQRFMVRCGSKVPILVLYNIPNRDLGSYSAGGTSDREEYLKFISAVAKGLGSKPALIILEPDAVAHAVTAKDTSLISSRLQLLAEAATILRAHNSETKIYLDVGHPRWVPAIEIKEAIAQVPGISGVSINVSNFVPLWECLVYGESLGVPYVIDTSRNGNNQYHSEEDGWCNPMNRKIGVPPRDFFETRLAGFENLDAYLWIKIPGESDGECNGGPKAGQFWYKYAKGLVS